MEAASPLPKVCSALKEAFCFSGEWFLASRVRTAAAGKSSGKHSKSRVWAELAIESLGLFPIPGSDKKSCEKIRRCHDKNIQNQRRFNRRKLQGNLLFLDNNLFY